MKKIIFKLFYKFLLILNKLSSNKLIYKIISNYHKNAYVKKKILSKEITFFIPNQITNWRVKTFFNQEPETLEWINNFQNKSKIIFWDIGANIGLYSIYATIKHSDIEVISFEPSTNNLRVLSRNISINNLENKIKINQLPLSDKSNSYELMNDSEFIEGYSMSTYAYKDDFEGNIIKPKNKYKILGTSINNIIENNMLKIPNYIKIDVDGIEHKILSKAETVLSSQNLRSVIVEINENFQEQYDEILRIMLKYNFKLRHKKQSKFELNKKFEKTFNYIFEKVDEI